MSTPIAINTPDEIKRSVVTKLLDWEKVMSDIVATKSDMDGVSDDEMATQLGLTKDAQGAAQVAALRSAYAAISDLSAQWSKSGQSAVLGIHRR